MSLFVSSFLFPFFFWKLPCGISFLRRPFPKILPNFITFADYKVYDIGLAVFDEDLGWVNKPMLAVMNVRRVHVV